ncbi:MAG TPA: hypothetical protein QF703_00930 [Candidatus Thalassarchaeaceae archaeon]|nr:hypothetical protein [Candidatus Thalassarchaeaceae archaeon]
MTRGTKLPMQRGFAKTDRTDDWWKGPTAMAAYLGFMVVYATWRGFMEADFWFFEEFGRSSGNQTMAIENQGSHVLSPLFSPLIYPDETSWIPKDLWWMSPAMFILIFPAGFRGTCYYYRKAYYRAFFQQPTGCAVSKPWNEYKGESGLLVVQNLHRMFMYVAVIYLPILTYDFWLSLNFHDSAGAHHFGISVGSLVLLLNLIMLSGYTFGCHAFRHVVGGGSNHWTGAPMNRIKYGMWRLSTKLNEHHKDWALYSLFWVMFTDFYIYACTDPMFGLTDIVIWGGV